MSIKLDNVLNVSMLDLDEETPSDVFLIPSAPKVAKVITPQELTERKRLFVDKYHHTWTQGELLNSLGIFAWDSIEDMILSAVAFPYTNLIFVGEAGSGKTNGARKILSALFGGSNVRKVDTAFEDELSLGICDVPDLVAKKMQTFLTDNAIVKFTGVVLDEINRSQEAQRKMYYPFLSERIIMGHLCKAMVVIGTMNPLGDIYNTEPLDLAFAERFVKVINIPEFHRVDQSYRMKMLKSVNNSLGLDLEINYPNDIQRPFQAALHATMFAYDEISPSLINPLVKYVDAVIIGAQATNPPLKIQSTRTGKNLIRNILRNIAFRKAVYGEDPMDILEQVAEKELNHVSTAELYDEPIDKAKLVALHAKAKQFLVTKNAMLGIITQLTNPCEIICALLSRAGAEVSDVDRNRLIQNSLDRIEKSGIQTFFSGAPADVNATVGDSYVAIAMIADAVIVCLELLTGSVVVTDSILVTAGGLFKNIINLKARKGSAAFNTPFVGGKYGLTDTRMEATQRLLQMPPGNYSVKGNNTSFVLQNNSEALVFNASPESCLCVSVEDYVAPKTDQLLYLTDILEEFRSVIQGKIIPQGVAKDILTRRLSNWFTKKEKYNNVSSQQD